MGLSPPSRFLLSATERKRGLSRSSAAILLPLLAMFGLFMDSLMYFSDFCVISELRRPLIRLPTLDVVLFSAARITFLLSFEERKIF